MVLAPVGSLESFHAAGAESVVRAVDKFGAAHMLSSVCDPGLEQLAVAAPNALRIYQLYVRGDEAWVDDHVERAIAHRYAAFCLTVDTAHYSRRERDIAKRFVTAGRRRVQGRAFQAALDWHTVKRIKSRFQIPLAIKGIATAEDAAIALDHGVEWIYVSNHGGRQLDQGVGSIEVLPEVVEAVGGRARVIVDGSITRGTDVVKAMMAGANVAMMTSALLKRGIVGAFHHVSRKHLHRYCSEFDFRWNTRRLNDGDRTVAAIQSATGKRLMYRYVETDKAA